MNKLKKLIPGFKCRFSYFIDEYFIVNILKDEIANPPLLNRYMFSRGRINFYVTENGGLKS